MKILETDRLILRKLVKTDFNDLFRIFSDPQTMTYYNNIRNKEETEKWIDDNIQRYKRDGFGRWAVILKEKNCLVGHTGFKTIKLKK